MDISEAVQGIRHAAYETGQLAMSALVRAKDLRHDTEFFEKVCQVALASLQLAMERYPSAARMSRLVFVLNTALMHDFYSFLKQPRQWLFPVSADMIDENAVLDSLEKILQDQLDPADVHHQEVMDLAKESLEKRLKSMSTNGDSYRSGDEFIDVLQRQIQNDTLDGKHKIFGRFHTLFGQVDVDLSDLDVSLRHVPLGERITNLNWSIVDMGCIGLFMKEWNLFDTAKWSARIGQLPGLQWVQHQQIDTWVIGLVCSGFALKIYEAARKLSDEALTDEERTQAHWSVAASSCEIVYYGAIYMNLIGQTSIAQSRICWMAILAKSMGLVSIARRPAHEYFQPKAGPAVS